MAKKKVSKKKDIDNKNLILGVVVILLLIGVFWYFNNQGVYFNPGEDGEKITVDAEVPKKAFKKIKKPKQVTKKFRYEGVCDKDDLRFKEKAEAAKKRCFLKAAYSCKRQPAPVLCALGRKTAFSMLNLHNDDGESACILSTNIDQIDSIQPDPIDSSRKFGSYRKVLRLKETWENKKFEVEYEIKFKTLRTKRGVDWCVVVATCTGIVEGWNGDKNGMELCVGSVVEPSVDDDGDDVVDGMEPPVEGGISEYDVVYGDDVVDGDGVDDGMEPPVESGMS